MTFSTETAFKETKDKMAKAVAHLEEEMRGIRTGRASPGLVEGIPVEVYASHQPIKNVAQIAIPDARTISIKPFDTSIVKDIERAIQASSLGVNPSVDGKTIRINLPPLSEDRRKQLVAHVKQICEAQRVALRNLRRDVLKHAEKAYAAHEITEDAWKKFDKQVSDHLKETEKKIDDVFKKKSEEVLTV
ncbi:MAG TPA: ribosome recycling factor [Planctomycetota bacterium]|nr:ribosome recycling factor [Planctomycetota bacterium]